MRLFITMIFTLFSWHTLSMDVHKKSQIRNFTYERIYEYAYVDDQEMSDENLGIGTNLYQLKNYADEDGSLKRWREKREEAQREFYLERLEKIREERHPASRENR